MATLTGAMLRYTNIKTIGLCHSVQVCTKDLFKALGMEHDGIEERIAGINHMAWLLEVKKTAQIYIQKSKGERKKNKKQSIMIWCGLN